MIKDSGQRSEFSTGAHRDCQEGKGRMDLLPFRALIELAKVYEEGAKKYDDNNWRKGIPLSRYVDSATRHLAKWMIGWRDEPHLAQCAWNIMSLIETIGMIEEGLLPADLNDLPYNTLEQKENPNNIPPLKTSSKRQEKVEVQPPSEMTFEKVQDAICRGVPAYIPNYGVWSVNGLADKIPMWTPEQAAKMDAFVAPQLGQPHDFAKELDKP